MNGVPQPDEGLNNMDSSGSPHNELHARCLAVVEQFGQCLGKRSRSRRDGFEPSARQHVEDYVTVSVLGVPMRALARARGAHHSTVQASVRRGERLVRDQAAERGFNDPFPSGGENGSEG